VPKGYSFRGEIRDDFRHSVSIAIGYLVALQSQNEEALSLNREVVEVSLFH
jgi:hypothetical protein